MLIASVGTIVICLLLTSSLGLKFVPPRKARYGRMSGAQRHFFVPNRCYIDSSPHASPTFSDTQMRYENSFRRWFLICPPLRWPFPKRQLLNLCSLLANALSNTPQYAPLPWYNLAAIPSGLPVLYWLRCFWAILGLPEIPDSPGPQMSIFCRLTTHCATAADHKHKRFIPPENAVELWQHNVTTASSLPPQELPTHRVSLMYQRAGGETRPFIHWQSLCPVSALSKGRWRCSRSSSRCRASL